MCTMNPDLTSGQRLMAESQHMGVEVKVAADKLDRLEAQNAKLRELAHAMLQYIDPASHQDTCGIECPAHSMCKGKSMCSFPDWAVKEAGKLGIEVE